MLSEVLFINTVNQHFKFRVQNYVASLSVSIFHNYAQQIQYVKKVGLTDCGDG